MTLFLLTLVFAAAPLAEVHVTPGLPSAEELVDEALAECRKADVKDDLFTSPPLMAALYDVGREEEARRMAFEAKGEIFRSAMIAVYVGIATERRGTPPDVAALIADEREDVRESVYWSLVEELSKLDRPAEAEVFFCHEADRVGTGFLRTNAAYPLIEAYRRAGDREAAKRIVRGGLEAGTEIVVSFVTSDRFDPLAAAAVDLDETEALGAVLDAAYTAVDRASERGELSVRMLARVGRWRAATGDQEGAKRAFEFASRVARELADNTAEEENELKRRLGRDEVRKAYVVLAANEWLAGFPGWADAWLDEFFRLKPEDSPEAGREDFVLSSAAEACLKAGDRAGADRLIAEVESPYYRVHVRIQAAEVLLNSGDADAARKLLAEASDEFERAGDRVSTPETEGEANRVSLLTGMATVWNRLGDVAAATALHRQASELAGDDAGHLQWLARAQVHSGRLAEAYATIHRMPANHQYRAWPLVELAAAAAKQEAVRARP